MATLEVDRVQQALFTWRARLLDLSKRNPLLYYRPTKSNTLRIACPDMFSVADELDEDGGGWEAYLPPEPEEVEGGYVPSAFIEKNSLLEFDPATTVVPTAEIPEVEEHPEDTPPEDALVFEPKTRREVERRLRNLMRRSETDLNERGVHTLYLAAGFLEWRDPASQATVRSPLLLFPVRMEKDSQFDPWRISPSAEEEITVNPALRRKILQDFQLSLPELKSAEEADRSEGGDLCRGYFSDVRDCLQKPSLAEWKVVEEAVIDLFSFHKLVMYRDVEQNSERAAKHPTIRALATGGAEGAEGGEGFPDERALDESMAYGNTFHVLDADSSQLAVLEAARKGRSLVLQGPPGTGKSQTISNLIAQSIAAGKTILFVSEKMAALDVVRRRLAGAGLNDLCLELHSHKTNRSHVVEQLARSLDERLEPRPGTLPTQEELARLEIRRRDLRRYVEELHKRREPLGKSVGVVLGELAHIGTAPARPMPEAAAVEALDAATWVRLGLGNK